MKGTFTTRFLNAADDVGRGILDQGLRTFNDDKSVWHRDIRQTGGQPFDIYIEDTTGAIVAGLYGEIYWQAMEVDRLWVSAELRHQGLGSMLITRAEKHAREQSCRFIHLSTFSFQAPEFYLRHGFDKVGELNDMPPGHSKIWLRKDLL